MYLYEKFLQDYLGKKVRSLTFIEYKKDVQRIKRNRKSVNKITHLVLVRCDCGNESWDDINIFLRMRNDKVACNDCINLKNKKEKELVNRLKNEVVVSDKVLSKGEYLSKYFNADE